MHRLLSYFAEMVKETREGQDMTMHALAKRAGLQTSTVSRIESRERVQPTLETILRVSWALQVSPKHFLPDLVDMKEIFEDAEDA